MNSTTISLITRTGRQVPSGVYRLMLRIEAHLKSLIEPGSWHAPTSLDAN
jgi:hypothetical protein